MAQAHRRYIKELTALEQAYFHKRELSAYAKKCQKSMLFFLQEAWHVVEPHNPYMSAWHIEAICAHLEAVTEGEIRKLIINIPPRHGKSTIVAVFWPVWVWLTYPHKRFLFSSYAASLSERDSLKCRRLIESSWFQKHFGEIFQLRKDKNTVEKFENNHFGHRVATSTGGMVTGEGGDYVVFDDAHNAKDISSAVKVESVLRWWDESMSTRSGSSPKTVCFVGVAQRLAENDLCGHLLSQGGYEHLCLPLLFEPARRIVTSLGWTDPRIENGEILCPSRFGVEEVEHAQKTLGSYGFSGQMQQQPVPRGGGIIKEAHIMSYTQDYSARYDMTLQSWDTAFKTGQENDYSCCMTFGIRIKTREIFVLDRFYQKVEFPELIKSAQGLFEKYKPDMILIEDKASGQSLIQAMKTGAKLPIKAIHVDSDKVTRVHAIAPMIESGGFYVPTNAGWRNDYIKNLTSFPVAAHDDDVDATSQALNYAAKLFKQSHTMQNVDIFGR